MLWFVLLIHETCRNPWLRRHAYGTPCVASSAGKMGSAMNNSTLTNELVDPDYDECEHDKLCDSDDE